ncbi:hypothetical protein PMAYCL1PPCAC_02349, partial [Pristionchus mayeri]
AYLTEHYIPQLFEGLMTGLIYNRPDDPIEFLEGALMRIRESPNEPFAWDMFINKDQEPNHRNRRSIEKQSSVVSKKGTPIPHPGVSRSGTIERTPTVQRGSSVQREESRHSRPSTREEMVIRRQPSVIKAAEVAEIPDVPVILFMGGPGGGKTKIAAKVYNSLADKGLVHVCMPDIVRNALSKYKDKYPEWREANEKYLRGELIPNTLALALVKAEMGRHREATAFFLEGFPREARQVEDFERQVKAVNMALILDYDERTLREHMERRGLGMEIIDQKIKEFKQKTLPSAKYFDDQKLLHLIPGEKEEHFIFDRMKHLVVRAMEGGISAPNTAHHREHPSNGRVSTGAGVAVAAVTHHEESAVSRQNTIQKSPSVERSSKTPQQGRRSRTPRSRNEEEHAENGHQRAETSSSKRGTSRGSRRSQREESASGRETSIKNHTRQESNENEGTTTSDERPPAPSRTSIQKVASVEKPATRQETSEKSTRTFKGLPQNAPVILIIGAPGSNKGEYAARIAKKYDGYVLLNMSDLLRKKVAESKGDDLWDRIGKKMDQGEAVPMKACRELLYTAIEQHQGTSWGYVIVGFPRNQIQMADFESVIGRLDISILIDCTEQYCTKSVNDRYQKGLTTGTQRADDAADIFKTRMVFFKQNTLPMLKYLDDKAKLRVVRADADMVDGDADEDKIFNDITTAIENSLLIDGEASGSSLESAKQS